MTTRGFFHSAIPGAKSWSLGISSEAEISVIKRVLTPGEEMHQLILRPGCARIIK
jgi:hypothetical protein